MKKIVRLLDLNHYNDDKNAKYCPLAPVEVKILISWGSAYKVEAENGTMFTKNANCFRSKK